MKWLNCQFDRSQNESLIRNERVYGTSRIVTTSLFNNSIVDTNREKIIRLTKARAEAEKDKKFQQIHNYYSHSYFIFGCICLSN